MAVNDGTGRTITIELCEQKNISRGYVVTKSLDDFGLLAGLSQGRAGPTQIMRIPAPLLCYWMGASELNQDEMQD